MNTLTIDEFKQVLPPAIKKSVNQSLIDQINTKLADPDMYETYRENLLGYVSVMQKGKFKLSGYVDAVKYVSHKVAGATNIVAFTITFPDKIKQWNANNVCSKDIHSYVTSYNKSKLVNLILEQTLTPAWVMNQDVYQRAINIQVGLMGDENVSPKVRSDAANSLLTHLKPPDTSKIELDIGIKPDSAIDALRRSTEALVLQQKQLIETGVKNAQEIAIQPLEIVDAELVEQ